MAAEEFRRLRPFVRDPRVFGGWPRLIASIYRGDEVTRGWEPSSTRHEIFLLLGTPKANRTCCELSKSGKMDSRRRIIDDALYVHFVTFSVDRRRRLLDHDHPKRIVLGVLTKLLADRRARCLGFVLMPEHVHALLWFDRPGQLSGFLHEWKRQSSLHIRAWLRTEAPNYCREFGEGRRFWLPKYYSFEIYETAKVEEKLDYMHLNPVRRGLVVRATHWRWSSARWYEWGRDVGVPIQWPSG